MMQKLLVFFLLTACALAQVVHFANQSNVPFDGYIRTNVDIKPPHPVGVATLDNGDTYVYFLGRQTSLDTYAVDVQVHLQPKEKLTIDLSLSKPASDIERPPIPADIGKWLGGFITCMGTNLQLVRFEPDGAAWLTHWRGRITTMFFLDIWVHHVASEPWAQAEALITCSNPSVPDMGEGTPEHFYLKFGDATVLVPGRRAGAPLIDAGRWVADGQAIALPMTLFWARHCRHSMDWSSVGCLSQFGIGAVGINKLLVTGNPKLPQNFNPDTWQSKLGESISRLHSFNAPLVGPNPRAIDTGAQADQTFVAGEALAPNGVGCERICYLGALKQAARPCHHLEVNGDQVILANHPQLVYWHFRPHIPGVSPDQLGKPRGLGEGEASGWLAPWPEHWFHNNMVAAARYTGSPMVQHLLKTQANGYPIQWTVRPELIYQSVPFAARAWGWEMNMAVHLWNNLEDRPLANAIRAHALERIVRVLIPQLTAADGSPIIDWIRDDRLGPGFRYMPWQYGIGCYYLDLAGEVFGHQGARDLAVKYAKRLITEAWWHNGEYWTCREVIAQDGAAVPSGSYDYFGNALTIACMMRHVKNHPIANPIWFQLDNGAIGVGTVNWIAPGVKATGR